MKKGNPVRYLCNNAILPLLSPPILVNFFSNPLHMHSRQPYSHKVQAKLFLTLLATMMILSTPLASASMQQETILCQDNPAREVPFFHLFFTDVTIPTYQNVTEQSSISFSKAKLSSSSRGKTKNYTPGELEAMLKTCMYNGNAADGLVWVPQEIPGDNDPSTFLQNKCFLRDRKTGRKISQALSSLIFISFKNDEDKTKASAQKGLSLLFSRFLYKIFTEDLGAQASPPSQELSSSDEEKSELLLQGDSEKIPNNTLGTVTTAAANSFSSDENLSNTVVMSSTVKVKTPNKSIPEATENNPTMRRASAFLFLFILISVVAHHLYKWHKKEQGKQKKKRKRKTSSPSRKKGLSPSVTKDRGTAAGA